MVVTKYLKQIFFGCVQALGFDREFRFCRDFAILRDPGYSRDRLNLPGSSREYTNLM